MSDLESPHSIKRIVVDVPKSAKFSRNFAKIITTRYVNIPPTLKKKFKANVTVEYGFGTCKYPATIRQSGDGKDHVQLSEYGEPFRSLSIKLKKGNIFNSVKFKLLLPETRNNLNEILGTVIMRELDFIAPETFQVRASINGVESIMLFQEDAKKELLERNSRREGPLFEGDEGIFQDEYATSGSLKDVMLARVTNQNWFLKGKNSQRITISAFEKLQKAYLENVNNIHTGREFLISPGEGRLKAFDDYYFLMIVMNGRHALAPNNRRYYYNSFIDEFEPIYYDGDLEISYPGFKNSLLYNLDGEVDIVYDKNYNSTYASTFNDPKFREIVLKKFRKRIVKYDDSVIKFFDESFLNLYKNSKKLQRKIDNLSDNLTYSDNNLRNIADYQLRILKHGLKQNNILSIESKGKDFAIHFANNKKFIVDPEVLAEILSRNKFNGKRVAYLPLNLSKLNADQGIEIHEKAISNGHIIYSHGISVTVDEKLREITLQQEKSKDWALFNGVNLSDWKVSFIGVDVEKVESKKPQRINYRGMTGCLNFYNSDFDKTSIMVVGGKCEDSLNIVKSKGNIKSISIESSYADGVDLDFSVLSIETIRVNSSENDCLDVSSGDYEVEHAVLLKCKDKAISVGEKSKFKISNVFIDSAGIGIASKDFSIFSSNNVKIMNTLVCIEVSQKKQEFGGAKAILKNFSCDGEYVKDVNSIILRGHE